MTSHDRTHFTDRPEVERDVSTDLECTRTHHCPSLIYFAAFLPVRPRGSSKDRKKTEIGEDRGTLDPDKTAGRLQQERDEGSAEPVGNQDEDQITKLIAATDENIFNQLQPTPIRLVTFWGKVDLGRRT